MISHHCVVKHYSMKCLVNTDVVFSFLIKFVSCILYLVHMNVFAKFDEIPSMILQDIKETKRYGHTDGRSFGRTVGQRENSIPSHKQSLRGV